MDNYARTIELVEIAQDSQGRSSQQFAKYSDSVEYSVKRLQNTWEQFRVSLADNEFYKGIINLANEVLDKVSQFDSIDWAKSVLIFTTVGKLAGSNFLSGMQQAISSGRNALQKKMTDLTLKKDGLVGTIIGKPLEKNVQKQLSKTTEYQALNNLVQQRENLAVKVEETYNKLDQVLEQADYPFEEKIEAAQKSGNEAEVERLTNEKIAVGKAAHIALDNYNAAEEEKARFDEQFDEQFQAQQEVLESKKQEISESYSKIYTSALSTVGTSAAAAFTSAFTAGMMTDDPSKVFISTLTGGITAAIPGIINTFNEGLATKGFGIAIAGALQTGLVSLLITGAIAGLAWEWKEIKQHIADENEKELRNSSNYYDAIKTIEELKVQEEALGEAAYKTAQDSEKSSQAYQDLADKTDELEKLRGKILLTTEESDRLVEVSNEIAKIAPELVDKYDSEGNAVIGLKSSYEELLETKKQLMLQDKESADQAALNLQAVQLEEKLQEKRSKESIQEEIRKSPVIENIRSAMDTGYIFENKNIGDKALEASLAYLDNPFEGFTYSLDLNEAELAQQGALLKELFKNISELQALQNQNDKDVINYLDELISGKDLPEMIALRDKMKDAIDSYSVNTAKVNSEIDELANTMLQTGLSAANTKLSVSSKTYQNTTDQNIRQLMQGYVLGESNLDWDSWSQQNPNATAEDWKKAIEAANVDIEGFENVFTEAAIALLIKIFSEGGNLSEIGNRIQKEVPEIYKIWATQNQKQIEAYNERFNILSNLFGVESRTNETFPKATGSGSKVNTVNLFKDVESDAFISSLQQWGGAGLQERFADILLKSGLDSEQISQIFNINWSEIATNEYEEQVDALAKILGIKAPELKKIVEDTGLFSSAITNTEEFKDSIDKQVKALDKYDKTLNAIKTSGESFAKDGKVSAAGIEALYDRGLDVAKLVNDDLSFNYQDARKAVDDILQGEIDTLKIRQASTQELHDQLLIANGLAKDVHLETLQTNGFDANFISKYFIKNEKGLYSKNDVLTTDLNETTKALEEFDSMVKTLMLSVQARRKEADSIFKGFQKELDDINDKREKAQQAVDKAYKDVLEKQQAVIDKEKELNKVLYGDSTAKNKLDVIYNYTTALDTLKETVDDAKKALDDLQGRDPSPYLNQYISGLRGQKGYLTASNDRYNVAINNIDEVLRDRLSNYLSGLGRGISNNVSDYYSYNSGLDRYVINYGALNAAQMNNDLKDFIEEQIDLMNQYKKNIKTNINEIENLEKEFRDYQRKARDNYISVQDSVAKTLKEYYQQQVEDKKELYDSLEEADNKYLDALEKAIDKQRKLRDKQNAWNDLSTKEKRLSLLQRDTSGANQRTTQSLQKEIQKDREKLLDDSVDSVVNELKEFYELQKETRDLEIEYQENVLENTNYIKEANALLEGWKTVDEMRDWMWEHTKDIDKMSDQAIEKLTEDWATMFDNIKLYNELTQKDIVTIFDVSNQEVQDIVLNTSETLTSEADRAFREVTEKVDEAIENAEKAVQDAMEALADAQNTYNEKLKEFNELISETDSQIQGLMQTLGESVEESQNRNNSPSETLASYYNIRGLLNNALQENAYTLVDRFSSQQQLKDVAEKLITEVPQIGEFLYSRDNDLYVGKSHGFSGLQAFKDGGLANYTGPAWVDGTPARPEAFLNADDTARIGEAANILASLASLGSNGTLSAGISSVIGDTNSQINIYVNSIATESQVDYLIDRVKEEFVDAANPIGTSVILHK